MKVGRGKGGHTGLVGKEQAGASGLRGREGGGLCSAREALRWVDALVATVGLRNQEQDVRKDRGDGGLTFPEGTMTILPLKADAP